MSQGMTRNEGLAKLAVINANAVDLAIRSGGDPEELLALIVASGIVDPHAARTPEQLVTSWLTRCAGEWWSTFRTGSVLVQVYPEVHVEIVNGTSHADYWRCKIGLPEVFQAFRSKPFGEEA